MIKKYIFWIVFFGLLSTSKSVAQAIILSDKTQISVLTCDTGNEIHTLFGHTAIRINDVENGFDAVYNFGYFDFNTPNFTWKFVKGDLKYFVAVDNFENFMSEYVYFQRGVYEQPLNITLIEKQNIFNDLTKTLQSEDRFYTYKFIDKNCTTMIVDLIKKNTGADITTNISCNNEANRSILYNYLGNHFYENLGINIIFGSKVDKKFDKIFLPLQLLESIKISKNSANKNLCLGTKTLNIQSANKHFSLWNNIISLILILASIVLLNKEWITKTYFFCLGIIGIFLLGVGFYSFHDEVSQNYNISLFNPLYILIVLFWTKRKVLKYLLLANAIILLSYCVFITNKSFLFIFLPIIATNSFLIYRIYKKI